MNIGDGISVEKLVPTEHPCGMPSINPIVFPTGSASLREAPFYDQPILNYRIP